jgi:hypothetical protein
MIGLVVATFIVVYLGMILEGLPFLQIDRTGVALLGAIALIGLGAVSLDGAAQSIHLPPGPRLPHGARVRVKAWGAVTVTDRGMSDDKLVCSERQPSAAELRAVLRFFRFHARCKGLLNLWRRRPGRNACEGWCSASCALARARPLTAAVGRPPIPF